MRLESADQHAVRTEDSGIFEHVDGQGGTMTPARRAALDALEREFRELLQAIPAQ
jgi:hypothetical protein